MVQVRESIGLPLCGCFVQWRLGFYFVDDELSDCTVRQLTGRPAILGLTLEQQSYLNASNDSLPFANPNGKALNSLVVCASDYCLLITIG